MGVQVQMVDTMQVQQEPVRTADIPMKMLPRVVHPVAAVVVVARTKVPISPVRVVDIWVEQQVQDPVVVAELIRTVPSMDDPPPLQVVVHMAVVMVLIPTHGLLQAAVEEDMVDTREEDIKCRTSTSSRYGI